MPWVLTAIFSWGKKQKVLMEKFPHYLSGSGIIIFKKNMFPHCREGSSTFHFYFFSLNLTVARAGGDEWNLKTTELFAFLGIVSKLDFKLINFDLNFPFHDKAILMQSGQNYLIPIKRLNVVVLSSRHTFNMLKSIFYITLFINM